MNMKKLLKPMVIAAAATMAFSATAFAGTSSPYSLNINGKAANGEVLVLVPLRETAEQLGFKVSYNKGTILVDDELRKAKTDNMLTETIDCERTIRQAERFFIDSVPGSQLVHQSDHRRKQLSGCDKQSRFGWHERSLLSFHRTCDDKWQNLCAH